MFFQPRTLTSRTRRLHHIFTALLLNFLLIMAASRVVLADTIVREVDRLKKTSTLIIPFAFYSEADGLAVGLAGGISGIWQDQFSFAGVGFQSTEDSSFIQLMGKDIQMPFVRRIFMTPSVLSSYMRNQRIYADGNPDFTNERSGSNDSSEDNFLEGDGWHNRVEVEFKYVLPIGHGRDQAINTYTLERGLLVSGATGGDFWNPLKGGRTFFKVESFFQNRWLREFDTASREAFKTYGLEFTLMHDNRDFPRNPEKGSVQRFVVARDFGWFDSSDTWTFLEGDVRKYFSLGATKSFSHRVIALQAWTAHSPTWKEQATPDGVRIRNRPPYYKGATLGGLNRLRAYPNNRFNDRSAIFYAAEFRVIPAGKPWLAETWLKWLKIKWWQLVPFAEVGRVADEWDVGTLHSNMKWDVGFGLRSMMARTVIRLDVATSDDSTSVWMMAGHPF